MTTATRAMSKVRHFDRSLPLVLQASGPRPGLQRHRQELSLALRRLPTGMEVAGDDSQHVGIRAPTVNEGGRMTLAEGLEAEHEGKGSVRFKDGKPHWTPKPVRFLRGLK